MANTVHYVIDGSVVFAVCILGVIGNIISCIFLCRSALKSPIICCLQYLVVYDTLFLTSKLFVQAIPYNPAFVYFYRILYPNIHWCIPLVYIFRTGSAWTTVCLSIERYFVICYPKKAKSLCKYNRSLIYNSLVAVLIIAVNIPQFFRYQMIEKQEEINNSTYNEISTTSLGGDEFFYETYELWFTVVIVDVIPFSVLMFVSFSTLREIKKLLKSEQSLSHHQKNDLKLAKMTFRIVFIFFLCYLPSLCFALTENSKDGRRFEGLLPSIYNLSEAINSTVHCIIYYKYRTAFQKILLNST